MRKRDDGPGRPFWQELLLAAAPPLASAVGEVVKELLSRRNGEKSEKSEETKA